MQPQELAAEIDDLQVVDVRERNEWEAGRIEGAVLHIPMGELAGRLDELDRSKPVVTVCRSGSRSDRAAERLRAEGFEAENLDGGLLAWFDAGLPINAPDGGRGVLVEPEPADDGPRADPNFQSAFVALALEIQEHFGEEEPSEDQVQQYLRDRMIAEGYSPEEADAVLARIRARDPAD